MISMVIGSSAGGAAAYHDKAFAPDGYKQGADNYYVNEMSEARWQGQGAVLLGIEGGRVTREAFIKALEGKLMNPVTGKEQDMSGVADRRAYYELTMAPPKSVSIVAILGDDERVRMRHEEANAAAMAWLEKKVTLVRVQKDGVKTERLTGNFLYATIQHEVSRANEPQIHNHNVLVAATFDEESGKWRALTNDRLLKLRMGADQIYKHVYAVGLQKDGYELEFSNDSFELAGFSKEQLSKFSTRSKVLVEILNRRGLTREAADFMERQKIVLATRDAKHELPREVLMEAWQLKADEVKLDVKGVVEKARKRAQSRQAGQERTSSPGKEQSSPENKRPVLSEPINIVDVEPKVSPALIDPNTGEITQKPAPDLGRSNDEQPNLRIAAMKSVQLAIGHLSEREQSFNMEDLEKQSLRFSKGQMIMPEDIEVAIAAHLSTKQLLWSNEEKGLMTTPQAVDREEKLLSYVLAGKGAGNTVLTSVEEFNEEVRKFNTAMTEKTGSEFVMSREQRVSAKNLLMHEDTFQAIQGEAGTGKTAALAMVYEVAEKKGWKLIGLATAGRAAEELESSSGIASQTIASFLVDLKNQEKLLHAELAAIQEQQMKQATAKERLLNITYGKDHYSLDRKTMQVYRNSRGKAFGVTALFVGLGHQLGVWSEDVQQKQLDSSAKNSKSVNVVGSLGAIAGKLGKYLLDHQKVGNIEAMAVRAAALTQEVKSSDLEAKAQAVKAKIQNLVQSGTVTGQKLLMVMDEASLTGINDALKVMRLAVQYGARVVFQGDTQQHSSVAAGRMFWMVQKAGVFVSTLKETMRFNKAEMPTKAAIRLMKSDDYEMAMKKLPMHVGEVYSLTAERYMAAHDELTAKNTKNFSIGVVTGTNEDRKALNESIQAALVKRGLVDGNLLKKEHYDIPKTTPTEKSVVATLMDFKPDRLIFNKTYKEIGVEKGQHLEVVGFNVAKNLVYARTEDGKKVTFNPARQDLFTPAKLEHREYAVGSQVETRAKLLENEAHPVITNSRYGQITAINESGVFVKFERIDDPVLLTNKELRLVDHRYAHTSFKEQGATNTVELMVLSDKGAAVFNRETAYVMATRAKGRTEVITSNPDAVYKNAGKEVQKTTAINLENDNPWKVLETQRKMAEAMERNKGKDAKADIAMQPNQDKGVDKGASLGM